MTIALSDFFLALPEFHPIDVYRKVGGFHTNQKVTELVDSVFQPGIISASDASETFNDQYRKIFIKNVTGITLYNVKVYGRNIKSANFIKFALEKGINRVPIIDGSEAIKDYRTPPSLYSEYAFTEVQSDQAMNIGNSGILPHLSAQGIWLRQRIPKNVSDIASDQFELCFFAEE